MYQDPGEAPKVEDTDQCYKCRWLNNSQKSCPLMEAIALGALSLEGDISIQNCDFFEKKVNLRVVK